MYSRAGIFVASSRKSGDTLFRDPLLGHNLGM